MTHRQNWVLIVKTSAHDDYTFRIHLKKLHTVHTNSNKHTWTLSLPQPPPPTPHQKRKEKRENKKTMKGISRTVPISDRNTTYTYLDKAAIILVYTWDTQIPILYFRKIHEKKKKRKKA